MSFVWKYFAKNGNDAKCKKCTKIYKLVGSTTSPLIYHLRTSHNIEVEHHEEEQPTPSTSAGPISKYVRTKSLYSLEEIICRSVAEDNMSVRAFKKSKI